MGGFGRYQAYVLIVMAMSYISFGYLSYNLFYYELMPQFECASTRNPNAYSDCEHEDFCDDGTRKEGITFHVKEDHAETLQNWVN